MAAQILDRATRIGSTLTHWGEIAQAPLLRWLESPARLMSRPLRVRLAVAASIVVAAFIVRWWLMAPLGPRLAYPIFYPAVVFAALVGGAAAGALAVASSVLLVSVVLVPTQTWTDLLGSGIFVLAGALTVLMTVSLQTAQQRIREVLALRDSDLRLRAVFDQQFQFMAVLSPDGRLLDVNDMPLRKTRMQRADLIGRPFADTPWFRNLPGVRAQWPDRLETAAKAQGPVSFEDSYNGPEGDVLSADVTVTAVRAEDGNVRFYIVQALDTTARNRTLEALRESEERMRLAVAVAQLGVYDNDWHRDTLEWSPSMRRILGIGPDERVSLALYAELVHPTDRPAVMAAIGRGHDPAGNGMLASEHRVVPRDGCVRWVALRGQTVFDRGPPGNGASLQARQRPARTIGVLLDISERKQAEHHQTMLIAELDHRVKNTLARVSTVVEVSRQNAGSMQDYADTLQGRIQSMATAHQLLSLHRWHEVLLSELLRQQLEPYGAPERFTIEGGEIRLQPDPAQALAMLFHELVTNAVKYGALSSQQGRVSVVWQRLEPPIDDGSPELDGAASHDGARGTTPESGRGQPPANDDDPAFGGVVLVWRETGGPTVVPPTRTGFGSVLIREIVGYELGGGADLVFAPAGLQCTVTIPDLGLHARAEARRRRQTEIGRNAVSQAGPVPIE